jgi:hypothetical protein
LNYLIIFGAPIQQGKLFGSKPTARNKTKQPSAPNMQKQWFEQATAATP